MRRHLALALLLATPPALAAEPEAAAAAQAAYREGVGAFKAGDYEAALARFEAAHALDPSPILLYNMARANEELGRPAAAIRRFEQYLDAAPDASDREDVERRIRVMRAIVENIEDGDRAALVATEVPPAPISLRPFAYGALAAGAVMVVVAIVGVVGLEGAREDYAHADSVREKQRAEDDGDSAALTANVGWITGGLLLAAGGVLWALEPEAPLVAPAAPPAPVGAFIGWSTSF
ncbi:MAG: tetratricopeptide repeat protein [bacterium]